MTKRLLPLLALLLVAGPLRAQAIDPAWMQVDSAARRVSIALLAGTPGVNGGLNFNGFSAGGLTLVVPAGWQVILVFGNQDKALTHSFEVITPRAPLPIQSVPPSIAGAGSKEQLLGLSAASPPETVRFSATTPGEYLVYCGVPGHGMAGMWVRLRIDATARMPSMMATPAPATR
jgi:hypothetical protein